MTLQARLFLISAFLAATLAVQLVLTFYMRGGAELEYASLSKSLTQLPLNFPGSEDKSSPARFGGWIGKVNAEAEAKIREQLPFQPDDLLSRTYVKSDLTMGLHLYMIHSRNADDRKHHPEVCIRDVTGAAEDLAARKILYVDAERVRPIQRFRFRTDAANYTTVYYWHYTLPRVPRAGETNLEVLYQRMNQPAPSITVQISLTGEIDQLEPVEEGFLVTLDQALRAQYLPAGTVMACDRSPIALQTTRE